MLEEILGLRCPEAKDLHRLGEELTEQLKTSVGVANQVVALPRRTIGSIQLESGIRNLVLTKLNGSATIFGRIVFPFPTLKQDEHFTVVAVTGRVLTGVEEDVVLSAGQKCFLSYDLQSSSITNQPRETNGDERRLIYGEIVEVASINAERTQVTLVDDLGRTYEPLGGKLRLYPFGDKLNENITIENLIIDGQDSLNFLIDNGIAMRYVDGVTIRNVTIRQFSNQGIYIAWSRNVTIENCLLENIFRDYNDFGQGYAAQTDACRFVTVKDCRFRNVRYGVSFAGGTMDAAAINAYGEYIFRSGAIVDIHGGDCLRISFYQCTGVYSGINLGNLGWRRGAQFVEVQDCTSAGLALMSSVRDLDISGWVGTRLTFITTLGDNGNGGTDPSAGYMNGTGAAFGGTDTAEIKESWIVFENNPYYDSARKVPIQLTASGTTTFRGTAVTFSECRIAVDYPDNQSPAVVADTAFDEIEPPDFAFTDCTIDTLQTASASYPHSFSLERTGPFALVLTNCVFNKTSFPQDQLVAGKSGSTDIYAALNCVKWTYPGGSLVTVTASNYTNYISNLAPPQLTFSAC